MRPLVPAAAVATAAALGGCVVHGHDHPLSYVGNAALITIGAAMLAQHQTGCDPTTAGHCPIDPPPVQTTDLIGASVAIAGVVGVVLAVLDRGEPAEARAPLPPLPRAPAAPAAAPDPSLDAARALTRDARAEARLGHCREVVGLGERVFQLAPAFHDRVFVRDPDIARCL